MVDATGSLIAELPEQGQLEDVPELDPWGVPVDAPSSAGSIADEKSFGFLGAAGRIEMPDSELTKLGARYYDAEVGAFLSVDPVVGEPAEPARRTPYTYGLSSPARFVDVDGRSAADAWKSAKKFVNEKASAVQERAAEITNDPNASWLAKASVVPIGLLSSLGTSENLADTLMAIAPIPGPGKLKGLGRLGEVVGGVVKGGREAGKSLRSVDEILSALPKGSNSRVRIVERESALRAVHEELARGGKKASIPGYPGYFVRRPDGTLIGLRQSSKSGGPTIDIRRPNGRREKVHVRSGN